MSVSKVNIFAGLPEIQADIKATTHAETPGTPDRSCLLLERGAPKLAASRGLQTDLILQPIEATAAQRVALGWDVYG
jgi:hypothetical protein